MIRVTPHQASAGPVGGYKIWFRNWLRKPPLLRFQFCPWFAQARILIADVALNVYFLLYFLLVHISIIWGSLICRVVVVTQVWWWPPILIKHQTQFHSFHKCWSINYILELLHNLAHKWHHVIFLLFSYIPAHDTRYRSHDSFFMHDLHKTICCMHNVILDAILPSPFAFGVSSFTFISRTDLHSSPSPL